ncbi:hypothetical protein [Myxococcus qinghaiensis]|uniref:hypothetical protein n=1 Tax=Myxococcus qinghaiensis TaxID=2906758 RepID=UPI0020A711D4|nr:hypothetical protein [Myxococcus qinghaiensis]
MGGAVAAVLLMLTGCGGAEAEGVVEESAVTTYEAELSEPCSGGWVRYYFMTIYEQDSRYAIGAEYCNCGMTSLHGWRPPYYRTEMMPRCLPPTELRGEQPDNLSSP